MLNRCQTPLHTGQSEQTPPLTRQMSNSTIIHKTDVKQCFTQGRCQCLTMWDRCQTELHTGQMLVFPNAGQMSNSVSQCGTDVKQRYTLDRCQNDASSQRTRCQKDAATQRTYMSMTQLHKGHINIYVK